MAIAREHSGGGRGSDVAREIQESKSSRTSKNLFLINSRGGGTPNEQRYNSYHQVQQPHCVTHNTARHRSSASAIKRHDCCSMIRNYFRTVSRTENDWTDGQVPHLSRLQILSPYGQAEDSSTKTEIRTTPDSYGEIHESKSCSRASKNNNLFLINSGASQTTNAMSTPNQQMYNGYHQGQKRHHCVTHNTTRLRSSAIAIKRHDRCAEDLALSQNKASSKKMYDWATWQMYNRIVDHRRNQSFNTALPTANDEPEPCHDERVDMSSRSHLSSDYYEGEVFELDI